MGGNREIKPNFKERNNKFFTSRMTQGKKKTTPLNKVKNDLAPSNFFLNANKSGLVKKISPSLRRCKKPGSIEYFPSLPCQE